MLNHKTLGQTLDQAIGYKHTDSISIDLEGDFDKYFNLKTKRGLETVVREIFTPDIMATLIDQKDRVNFESYGSQLYVYQLGFIGGKDAMCTFYENATTIATMLISHFKETSSELAAKGTLEHV